MNVKLLIIILDREALFHHARLDLGRVNLRRIDYIIGAFVVQNHLLFPSKAMLSLMNVYLTLFNDAPSQLDYNGFP